MHNKKLSYTHNIPIMEREVSLDRETPLIRNRKPDYFADFELNFKEDGVYFNTEGSLKSGKVLDTVNLYKLIERKKLYGVDIDPISLAFANMEAKEVLIAPPQEEIILNEEVVIEVSKDKMEAYIELLPAESKGEVLTYEGVVKFVADAGIVYNTNYDLISELYNNQIYYKKRLISKGIKAVNGIDGELIFHFDKCQEKTFSVEYTKEGKIDFKEINKIINVEENQVLIERKLATLGKDGYNVFGETLIAKNGKDVLMPKGKNIVYSEDRCTMYAKVTGGVTYRQGIVTVTPIIVIQGDVDLTVGNIDFIGDIVIRGSVKSGFVLKSGGNITVMGVVENARLESKGDIILAMGIQGLDSGVLVAQGGVISKYIQRATVISHDKICAEYIMHSNLMCEGVVEVLHKDGAIMGGKTRAKKSVVSRSLGGVSHVPTYVEIGISPFKRERYDALVAQLLKIQENISRMELALNATKGSLNKTENTDARFNITIKLLELKRENEELLVEFKELAQEMLSANSGNIHVLGKVHPGVRIAIGTQSKTITAPNAMITYNVDESKIVDAACKFDYVKSQLSI